jgi:transcriptional regulator with XRE-family HTH domain
MMQRFTRLRKERGLTRTDVADLLGVTVSAVATWEAGGRPSLDNVELLCKYFKVTPGFLYDERRYSKTDAPHLKRVA